MIRTSTKYFAIFRTQLLNSLAYPSDLLAGVLSIVVFMWIFTQLWRVTYSAVGSTEIENLSLRETLWYLMLAEAILLSKPRISYTIGQSVKDGSVAYLLNKPYNFILYHASTSLGVSLFLVVLNIIAGGLVVWLAVGPPPGPVGWPFVFITILLAWAIDFCIQTMIGLLAFITEDISAFDWIYSKFVLILGGVLIPLDFFPTWLRDITLGLPFAYTIYGPAKLFIDASVENFFRLFFGQSAWILLLGGVLALFYRRSVQHLSINGG